MPFRPGQGSSRRRQLRLGERTVAWEVVRDKDNSVVGRSNTALRLHTDGRCAAPGAVGRWVWILVVEHVGASGSGATPGSSTHMASELTAAIEGSPTWSRPASARSSSSPTQISGSGSRSVRRCRATREAASERVATTRAAISHGRRGPVRGLWLRQGSPSGRSSAGGSAPAGGGRRPQRGGGRRHGCAGERVALGSLGEWQVACEPVASAGVIGASVPPRGCCHRGRTGGASR